MKKIGKLSCLFVIALALFASAFSPAANAAQVAVTVETLTAGAGFMVEPLLVTLSGNTTAAQAILDLLSSMGLSVSYEGGATSQFFYIKNIAGLGDDSTNGWMVTVNNSFIKTAAGIHTLKDGDVMRWQYTKNYGHDIGTNIFTWGDDYVAVPSTMPSKDALIRKIAQINKAGNRSEYSTYSQAMNVLSTLNPSPSEISNALNALNTPTTPTPTPVDPGTTPTPAPDTPSNPDTPSTPDTNPTPSPDTPAVNPGTEPSEPGTSPVPTPDAPSVNPGTSGNESAVIAAQTFTPPAGIESASGARVVTAAEIEALGIVASAMESSNGVVVIKGSEFINGLSAAAASGIDTAKAITPLPVFHSDVTAGGTTLVTLKVNLDSYGGEDISAVAVLKMTRGGSVVRLLRAVDQQSLISGAYIWTDALGYAISPSEEITAGGSYFMSVAIEDNSEYDLDGNLGTIVDPLSLAVTKKTSGGGYNGDGINAQSDGGGCDTGAFGGFGLASLAICSLALTARKRRV